MTMLYLGKRTAKVGPQPNSTPEQEKTHKKQKDESGFYRAAYMQGGLRDVKRVRPSVRLSVSSYTKDALSHSLTRQLMKYGPIRHHWCVRFEANRLI